MNERLYQKSSMKSRTIFFRVLILTLMLGMLTVSCSRETTKAQRKGEKALEEAEMKEQQAAEGEYDLAVKNHWDQQSKYALKMNKSTKQQAREFNKSFKRKGSLKCF